jgi:hypothetical protein
MGGGGGEHRARIPDVRLQIVKWAIEGVTDEEKKQEFDYEEVRPELLVWKKPIRIDCSFYCKLVYFMAGAIDPTGENFNGYGNSESMYVTGKHITLGELMAGDCCVFGPGGSVHAVIAVTDHETGDPLFASMGRQGDPSLVRLSELLFLGEPTYLRYSTRNRHLPPLKVA